MKVIYIDTNVVLRFLLNDLPDQYEKAKQLFTSTERRKVRCASEVMAEVVFVLISVYKVPKDEAAELIARFVRTTPVEVQNKEMILWILDRFSLTGLAYIDLLITKYAQDEGGTVFSFDQKLMKMQKKLV